MSGRRNDSARSRHRNDLKQHYSLTSVPRSEVDVKGNDGKRSTTYNLNNHFGWVVLQKSFVDGNYFPNMSQHYQKPEVPSREGQRVTYVFLMEKGTVVDTVKAQVPKETQTTISGDQAEHRKPKSHERRVTLQDENIYINPFGDRRRRSSSCFGGSHSSRKSSKSSRGSKGSKGSRSSKSKKDKQANKHKKGKKDRRGRRKSSGKSSGSSQQSEGSDFEGQAGKVFKIELDKIRTDGERTFKDAARKEVNKQKKNKKRSAVDRWQLRALAGAEQVDPCEACEDTEKINVLRSTKESSKLIGSMKFTTKMENKPIERLMETSSKTNKYLFVGRSASLRRSK